MPRTLRRSVVRVTTWLACVCLAGPAWAQITATPYISSGLTLPVAMVQDPSDPGTQYVVEQGGLVKVIRNGALQPQPFIDLTAEAVCCGERGLLGLAFPNDYARTGRFYLNFTSEGGPSLPGGATVVARFRRSATNPLLADKATRFDLLWPAMPDLGTDDLPSCSQYLNRPQRFVCQPFSNHNGGKMAFGPDGYLYIAFGDGGSGGDPGNQAQRRGTVLGKIVRLDVNVSEADARGYRIPSDNPFAGADASGTLDEIWAFGARNPWRFTFDEPIHGGTGAFTMGDVGQGAWEEIDYVPGRAAGRNFGWRNREGRHDLNQDLAPAFVPLTEPIFEYGDPIGVNNSTSITGGYVYRGTAIGATFQGRYFYADYISGRVFSLGLTVAADGTATASGNTEHTSTVNPTNANIASIDVDFYGEIYLVKYDGQIVKLVASNPDTDADGLPDALERRYGLDPGSSTGSNGPSGDPDIDGVLNSAELTQGSHPRGLFTRYLAEGAASTFFETTIALANPATQPALVHLRFLRDDGTVATWPVTVAAKRRLTVDPGQLGAVFSSSFATIVESDVEIVVERTMRWDQSEYGAHTEAAVASPSSTWYFAEGSQGFFSTFLLLTNTSGVANNVQVRWLIENGAPVVQTYTVQPLRRLTLDAGGIAALANTSFGIEVTFQNAPGIAERAMYFGTPPDVLWKAGHESAGVTAPALEWFLAEGATGPFFETFVLITNPGGSPANVTVTYVTSAGQTVTRPRTVPANSRLTVNIESENAPELENAAVATRVQSTSVPIVVERAQYWPYSFPEWYEAHNSFGVTQPHTHWGLAEGQVGRATAAQTYILLANNNAAPANVTIEFLRETSPPVTKTFVVPGQSRFNVPVGAGTQVPELGDEKFGAVITSSGPIVVERALYLSSNGVVWSAGTNATATRLP